MKRFVVVASMLIVLGFVLSLVIVGCARNKYSAGKLDREGPIAQSPATHPTPIAQQSPPISDGDSQPLASDNRYRQPDPAISGSASPDTGKDDLALQSRKPMLMPENRENIPVAV